MFHLFSRTRFSSSPKEALISAATKEETFSFLLEAAARFDKDLEIAKKIQHSALPSVVPPYPNRKDFSIFASMDAAKMISGMKENRK